MIHWGLTAPTPHIRTAYPPDGSTEMLNHQTTFGHLRRYARMYHRRQHEYGHVIAPGHNAQTVLFAYGSESKIAIPVSRTDLRYLRWYERLFNR